MALPTATVGLSRLQQQQQARVGGKLSPECRRVWLPGVSTAQVHTSHGMHRPEWPLATHMLCSQRCYASATSKHWWWLWGEGHWPRLIPNLHTHLTIWYSSNWNAPHLSWNAPARVATRNSHALLSDQWPMFTTSSNCHGLQCLQCQTWVPSLQ